MHPKGASSIFIVFFILFFAHLFVPLTLSKVLAFERKNKKRAFLFCSLLTYSYLCSDVKRRAKNKDCTAYGLPAYRATATGDERFC